MLQSTKVLRVLVPIFALSLVAGCAQQTAPRQVASASDAELAGAWYQVYFDSNKSDLDARGQMIVKNVAYVVANNDKTRVTVMGKADRVGTSPDNLDLSKRRADRVRDALIGAGVPAARIDTGWTGEATQKVATADDAAERRNRVVDVTVIKQMP